MRGLLAFMALVGFFAACLWLGRHNHGIWLGNPHQTCHWVGKTCWPGR